MDSIPTQVRRALADFKIDIANEQSIVDLSEIRAHYEYSMFTGALVILVRAYRERLEALRKRRELNSVKPEFDALLLR
jgi:hypothetical protein